MSMQSPSLHWDTQMLIVHTILTPNAQLLNVRLPEETNMRRPMTLMTNNQSPDSQYFHCGVD